MSAWHANRERLGPDCFDITVDRGGGRVLTFGAGSHYRAGANLVTVAVMESSTIWRESQHGLQCGPPG